MAQSGNCVEPILFCLFVPGHTLHLRVSAVDIPAALMDGFTLDNRSLLWIEWYFAAQRDKIISV